MCYNILMEKLCSTCNLVKLHGIRRGDKPNSRCIDCQRVYTNDHYAKNKETRRKQIQSDKNRRRLENLARIESIKIENGCVDCRESDPIVLEFDHLSDKKYSIANMVASHTWESIWSEIQKCEVVCANCHRRRTHQRRII